jgi:hypothetical protein
MIFEKDGGDYSNGDELRKVQFLGFAKNLKSPGFMKSTRGIGSWGSEGIIDNCKFWGCEDEGIALIGKHGF